MSPAREIIYTATLLDECILVIPTISRGEDIGWHAGVDLV